MQADAIDVLCRLIWQNRCNASDVYGQNLKTGDLTVSLPCCADLKIDKKRWEWLIFVYRLVQIQGARI
ncbi:hypothetical protein EAI77_06190 [Ligilactobacillus ruminis]|nr:hypothetical protein EAI77_06190 [Ligilactobacillus ruminis]